MCNPCLMKHTEFLGLAGRQQVLLTWLTNQSLWQGTWPCTCSEITICTFAKEVMKTWCVYLERCSQPSLSRGETVTVMSLGNKSQTGGCWGHLTRKWSVENPGCKVTVSDFVLSFPNPATPGLCLFVGDLCAVFYLCFKVMVWPGNDAGTAESWSPWNGKWGEL